MCAFEINSFFYTTGKQHILCAIQSRYTQVRRRTSQNDLVLPMGTLASAGTSMSIFCTLYYLEISQQKVTANDNKIYI